MAQKSHSLSHTKWQGVKIIEGHLMPDHVHMLVIIPPRICLASFRGYLKGKVPL